METGASTGEIIAKLDVENFIKILMRTLIALDEIYDASTCEIIAELDVENLIENLVRTLIAFDEIYGEGELKLQIREHVLTLDLQN